MWWPRQRAGECSVPRPIHWCGNFLFSQSQTTTAKCAGAPPCWNQYSWCCQHTVADITRYSTYEDMTISVRILRKKNYKVKTKQMVSRNAHPHHHMRRIVFIFLIKVRILLSPDNVPISGTAVNGTFVSKGELPFTLARVENVCRNKAHAIWRLSISMSSNSLTVTGLKGLIS